MASLTMSLNCPGFTLTWNYQNTAVDGGYLNITVNSNAQIYTTASSDSGSFLVQNGDFVQIYAYASTYSTVYAYGSIAKDGTSVANPSQVDNVYATYGFYVSGNHTIDVLMYDGA